MLVETLPVAELEAPEVPACPEPDAPACPEPDGLPEVPAWPAADPDPDVPDPEVPLAPDCVLCEPDPPVAAEGRGEPDAPGEAAGPPLCWPDIEPLPLPPEADGAFEAPPPPLAPGDVAAPPPAPPPLVCATPAATLKAKAATAAVLRSPYRMIETSRFRRTLASGGGSNAQGLGKFRPPIGIVFIQNDLVINTRAAGRRRTHRRASKATR
jgi:hypothetical protein